MIIEAKLFDIIWGWPEGDMSKPYWGCFEWSVLPWWHPQILFKYNGRIYGLRRNGF